MSGRPFRRPGLGDTSPPAMAAAAQPLPEDDFICEINGPAVAPEADAMPVEAARGSGRPKGCLLRAAPPSGSVTFKEVAPFGPTPPSPSLDWETTLPAQPLPVDDSIWATNEPVVAPAAAAMPVEAARGSGRPKGCLKKAAAPSGSFKFIEAAPLGAPAPSPFLGLDPAQGDAKPRATAGAVIVVAPLAVQRACYHQLIAASTAFHSDPNFCLCLYEVDRALCTTAGAEAQAKAAQAKAAQVGAVMGTLDADPVEAAEPQQLQEVATPPPMVEHSTPHTATCGKVTVHCGAPGSAISGKALETTLLPTNGPRDAPGAAPAPHDAPTAAPQQHRIACRSVKQQSRQLRRRRQRWLCLPRHRRPVGCGGCNICAEGRPRPPSLPASPPQHPTRAGAARSWPTQVQPSRIHSSAVFVLLWLVGGLSHIILQGAHGIMAGPFTARVPAHARLEGRPPGGKGPLGVGPVGSGQAWAIGPPATSGRVAMLRPGQQQQRFGRARNIGQRIAALVCHAAGGGVVFGCGTPLCTVDLVFSPSLMVRHGHSMGLLFQDPASSGREGAARPAAFPAVAFSWDSPHNWPASKGAGVSHVVIKEEALWRATPLFPSRLEAGFGHRARASLHGGESEHKRTEGASSFPALCLTSGGHAAAWPEGASSYPAHLVRQGHAMGLLIPDPATSGREGAARPAAACPAAFPRDSPLAWPAPKGAGVSVNVITVEEALWRETSLCTSR